jgi:hypothetical protein
MLRAQAPTHRPVWMIVLAATMLLHGGFTLVAGLLMIRDPGAVARQVVPNVPRPPEAEAAVRQLEPIMDAIIARHRAALRVDAIASLVYGLFTLYAVAAVLSRDRHGRLLAVSTAIFGIVYQLAELPHSTRITREIVTAAGPLLAEMMAASGDGAGKTQAELVATLDAVSAARAPVLTALGVGWCLLLLLYFGGRRGRELYGLPLRGS